MEINNQMIDDSELPLEENFYQNGKNICKAKELSFMTINFYNVSNDQQEFVIGILKQFNYQVTSKNSISDKVKMVCICL